MKKPVMLCIMDGYGIEQNGPFNAIACAKKPNLDALFARWPYTTIKTSGLDVGLPDGQMGNSEVGHTNMGAGRIVYQDLTAISAHIADGTFFKNRELLAAIENAEIKGTALHLMGLLSDGGVHSSIEHLFALLRLCKEKKFFNVFVHCFLDGRDTPPQSGQGYVVQLEEYMRQIGVGAIATVGGRYYAMDRDNRWERVEKAYAALVYGEGVQAQDAAAAVGQSYAQDVNDEFMLPTVIDSRGTINSGDSVIFFNFRPDRARQITRALCDYSFNGFAAKKRPEGLYYVCLTQYDANMPNVKIAFEPQSLNNTFGAVMQQYGKTQLRIAETEKYAHVTFFFNGGIEQQFEGEQRILVPSPKVATYDLQPAMSAFEVTDKVLQAIESCAFDAIILNFANCDMVGHTGILAAAIAAVEAVDACVGRIAEAVLKQGGAMFLTADHGNAEHMRGDHDEPFTAHTTNVVPLCAIGLDGTLRPGGRLCDIAPTMLHAMDIIAPKDMTGENLLTK